MRGYSFSVAERVLEDLTSPVRRSVDVADMILRIAGYVQINQHGNFENSSGNLLVLTEPVSRLVVKRGDGIISISFPFSVAEVDGFLRIWCPQLSLQLDNRSVHFVRGFLRGLSERDIVDVVADLEQEAPDYQDFLQLGWYLLNCDHGYFRVDSDPERVNGDVHPLNHIDFFYANYSGVKVGLERLWGIDLLKNFLNCAIDRPFLAFRE